MENKPLRYFTGVRVKFHGPTDTKPARVRATFCDPTDAVNAPRKSRTIDWNEKIEDCYTFAAQLLMNDVRPFRNWVPDCRISTDDGCIIGFMCNYDKASSRAN
jgi:hypothetical protein